MVHLLYLKPLNVLQCPYTYFVAILSRVFENIVLKIPDVLADTAKDQSGVLQRIGGGAVDCHKPLGSYHHHPDRPAA